MSIEEYMKKIKEQNANEYIEEKNTSEIKIKNQKAYQMTSEVTDGETLYIMQEVFVSKNDKIYMITFFGSEKEHNNLKKDIDEFISNFEI